MEGLHYLFINKCRTCHRPYNHDVGRECFCYLSKIRKSVSSDIQTLRRRLKKRGAASVLHCFSKNILREKRGKSSPNFMIITLVESGTIFLLCKCYFRELLKWYLRVIFSANRESEDTHQKSIFLLFRQNVHLSELIQGKIV